jgi:hypothetical protein
MDIFYPTQPRAPPFRGIFGAAVSGPIWLVPVRRSFEEGFKLRVATYIKRTHGHREAPWTRPAPIAGVSI